VTIAPYHYFRADGVAAASPLFQAEGGGAIPTSALQLRFSEIAVDDARALNALWHSVLPQIAKGTIVGAGPFHACYAAEYDGGYYAAAIWSTPPAVNRMKWTSREVLELRRMAIAPQAPKNTASRMLSYMSRSVKAKFPSLICLISYQDTERHTGTIYKAAGWKAISRTPFKTWAHPTRPNRQRRPSVSTADKIRWELEAS